MGKWTLSIVMFCLGVICAILAHEYGDSLSRLAQTTEAHARADKTAELRLCQRIQALERLSYGFRDSKRIPDECDEESP